MTSERDRIPATGTAVGVGPDDQPRARIMQGGHAQVGPVHVGVLAARQRDGGGEVFARLLLGSGQSAETVEVTAGDAIDLGTAGILHIVQIAPQDLRHHGPDMPGSARGAVFLELTLGAASRP